MWNNFLRLVKNEAGNQVVDTWLKSVFLLSFEKSDNKLIFSVPNQFVNSWIKKNYLDLFKKYFSLLLFPDNEEALSINLVFEFKVTTTLTSQNNFNDDDLEKSNDPKDLHRLKKRDSSNKSKSLHASVVGSSSLLPTHISLKNKKNLLSDKYSFKNFVVGPHNHLAYSAAQAVSKGCYKRYNPLFIYGKTGLGKTHLLHCIGNEYKKNNNEGKVIYKSSVSFVDEFILAIRQNKIQNFTDKYRKIDMLLIDDVQFFAQKEQTQEAFFHIFNQMYDEKKQIVLSCDMMPQQLSGFQERLISRFSWGLSADITTPTLETRIAILQHKAEELKIELSHEVANFIATTFITNIREMEGALTKLAAMTLLTFSPISLALAKKELTMTSISPALSITKPDDIVGAILKNFSVSVDDLRSRSRDSNLVAARQLTVYLLKKYTTCSLRTIGYFVGGRTHSTVLHAIAKVEKQLVVDALLQNKLKGIENNLN